MAEHKETTRSLPKPGLGAELIGKEEEELVLEVLRKGDLFRYYGRFEVPPTMVRTLESEFADRVGTRFALAVTSGTAALETAIGAFGIGPGDDVIIPAWSWISCFTAVVRMGARPVLAEIDESFCLAPGEISRLRTKRTKAVMIVHYQGVAADLEPILAEAQKANIRVLEDCAQSPGVTYRGRAVGAWGDIGIFSFQHNKTITSGEGGMLVTNDPSLFERSVRMHDIGQYRPIHARQTPNKLKAFSGSQFRMSELTGAVALAQLRKLQSLRSHFRQMSRRLLDQIGNLPGLQFRHIPDPEGDLGFEVYFMLPTSEAAGEFNRQLCVRGVCCQQMTGTYCHYRRDYCQTGLAHTLRASPFSCESQWPAQGYREEDFPKTENLIHRFIALPLGVSYHEREIDYIGDSVKAVYDRMGISN